MKIENVFIQATDGMPDDEAFFKAWHGFAKRHVPCELVSATELESGSLPLRRSTLVAGGIRTVESAIEQIGMRTPIANNLPDELSPWFGSNIRKTTLGDLRKHWNLETPESCFIKPLDKNKLFPAIAMFDSDDLATLDALDDGTRVLVSEYVLFESEWRVFVVQKEIVGMSHYQGNCFRYPNADKIKAAINAFKTAPAAYGIDFGVLSNGDTVLVEANDGYSLGSYSLNSVDYSRLLEARWAELAA